MTVYPVLNDLSAVLNQTLTQASVYYQRVPGSAIVLKYIKNSYQDDPYRSLLELLLLIFAIKYLLAKRYRTDNFVELTPKEVEELIEEWEPEPLVPPLTERHQWELDKTPMIVGPHGPKPTLANGKTVMNLASFDFLGLANNERIKEKAIQTLRKYGVGSCGPPGFYGTIDVHTEFEKQVSLFLGTEDTIIYSQGFSTVGSAIPSFCKRGDIVLVDKGCNFAIQKGVQISRSIVKWFNHNDMEDLENILKTVKDEDIETGRSLTRRFIITEGLFENSGDIAPLPELIELKKKYKYRLILDESLSFGTLGKRGAGLIDYYDIDPSEIDMIVGSMCTALCSSGGFCSGSHEVTEHQRISGAAYCFSASLPAMLTVSATESLNMLMQNPGLTRTLLENSKAFCRVFSRQKYLKVGGFEGSPVLHICLNEHASNTRNNDEKETVLQQIVDEVTDGGVLVTRAKYVLTQEQFPAEPSIRVCISASFSKGEIVDAGNKIKNAAKRVLERRTNFS